MNSGAPTVAHGAGFAFVHDRTLHCVQRVHESVDITHIDSTIPVGWQRAAGEEVDVGALATDEQNSFSGLDACVDLRRKYIAYEGIEQRNQVNIRSEEKSRKVLERNQVRSVKTYTSRAKFTFDPISLRSRGIQPEPKTELRLLKVFGVCLDECVVIVGNAPIA